MPKKIPVKDQGSQGCYQQTLFNKTTEGATNSANPQSFDPQPLSRLVSSPIGPCFQWDHLRVYSATKQGGQFTRLFLMMLK